MISLRPYQIQAVNDIREAYREHNRILLVMPTGSGKTCTFSFICASAVERGKRVLILSDRVEIFAQTLVAVSKHKIQICKIDAENKMVSQTALVYMAMVETFKRRLERYKHIKFDLIVIDEAHKAAFNKIMDAYPNTKTLGCTATPVGKSLHKYYTKLIQSIDIPELIEQGYLSPCRGFQMQDNFDDLVIDKTGEFSDQSQYAHFHKSKLYEGVIEKWIEKAKGKKTLIFNCNIAHAIHTTEAFNAAGIPSRCITSETSKQEREWILHEYDRGMFCVLNNANILIAGYDNPSIEVIIMNRATTAINVWLQAGGRGSRIFPGKSEFLLIDFGGNFSRHGLWNEPRKWSLDPPKKRNTLGAPAVKTCKQCGAIQAAAVRKCEFCGFIWEKTAAELKAGQLIEVSNQIRSAIPGKYISQCTVPELIELERAKVIKPAYCWRILRARGAQDIGDYARIKGYRDAWIIRQIEALEAEAGTDKNKRIQFFDKKINQVPLTPVGI
jgi:superfamily II DNA or RNA helicase